MAFGGDQRHAHVARDLDDIFDRLSYLYARLSVRSVRDISARIAKIRDEIGCGVLLVEHDMRIIFRVCERIQVIDFGKPLLVGTPEEIRSSSEVIAAYLGVKGAEIAQEHHKHA